MSYHVVYAGERGVRLKRRSAGGGFAVLVAMAALGSLGASALMYAADVSMWPMPFTVGMAFIGAFGAFRGAHYRITPGEVVFDNLSGQVVLIQSSGGPIAYLPYRDIEGFRLLAEERQPGENADGLPRYTVQLASVDLPELALGVFGDATPAQELLELLRTHVRLAQTSAPSPAPRLPALFRVRQQGASSELLWKPRQTVAGVFAPFMLVTAYFTFLYYFHQLRDWNDTMEKFILRAMTIGGGIVGVALIGGQLFADRRTRRVAIDARGLAYSRVGKGDTEEMRLELPAGRQSSGFRGEGDDTAFKRRIKEELLPQLSLESLNMVERVNVLQYLARTAGGLTGPQPVDATPSRLAWWQQSAPSPLTRPGGLLGIALIVLGLAPFLLLISALVARDATHPALDVFRLTAFLRVGTSVVAGYQLRDRPGDRLGSVLLLIAMLELVSLLVGERSAYSGYISLALTFAMVAGGIRLISGGGPPAGDERVDRRK